jgi:hypothetical protein
MPDVPPVPPVAAPVVPPVAAELVLLAVPAGGDDVVSVAELVLLPALSCRPHAESDKASATPAAIQSCFMRRCLLQC